MIIGEGRRQIAGSGFSLTGQCIGNHLVGIQRIHHCLADLNVIPRSLGDVVHQEANAKALNGINGAASILQLVNGISRYHFHGKRRAIGLRSQTSGGIFEDVIVKCLILSWSYSVIVWIWLKIKGVVTDGLVHPRTGSNGHLFHIVLNRLCRNNADNGETLFQKREVWHIRFDGNGSVIFLFNGCNGSKH